LYEAQRLWVVIDYVQRSWRAAFDCKDLRMSRLVALTFTLVFAGLASAQCSPWYPYYVVPPGYPLTSAVWGAPVPKPLPPALPPIKSRPIPAIREDDEPAPPAKSPDKPKNGTKSGDEAKEKDTPRIPKTRVPIPGDPLDKSVPEVPKNDSPKSDAPKKDAAPNKAVEQFVIPADGRGEPQAQVKVGFFNHSDRDLVLDVNGEAVKLAKEQFVTLRLPRTFRWMEKGGKDNSVVVPPDAEGIEIVFRR
jgi:hypothetical protein